jgi:hypothetical protein
MNELSLGLCEMMGVDINDVEVLEFVSFTLYLLHLIW